MRTDAELLFLRIVILKLSYLMRMKYLLFGLMLLMQISATAQNNKKEVLFTIDGKPYYTDEFLRVYKKNLDLVKDDSQKDLNQYLELFIGYKLKINKAHKLGLQNGPQYQTELKTYRNQLAKNYTTDSKVTGELVQEAYNRLQKEVNASHILILCEESASPADTLKAYKQIADIRKRAAAGEDFGKLAREFSQDPSAKENNGELGYFTAFRMVYAFESAAYHTPKGSISKPIRTRFGYHIIKVNDVRDNRGELTVAHIMLTKKPKKDEGSAEAASDDASKSQIQDIYKKLQQGESFEALAKQFSEDKSSAGKGGVLGKFGSGQLSSEKFEDMAFSLAKEGDISEPFETEFGWHIVKLIARHPVRTLDQMKSELESKIGKDERSRLIEESVTGKLRGKYPVKRNEKVYGQVKKAVTDKFYEGTWDLPENKKPFETPLFEIKGAKPTNAVDFLEFVKTQQKIGVTMKPIGRLVDHFYGEYVDKKLNEHYNENLENEFPEFSYVMDEYRDGLLLFDLMEKEIWEKSKTDSIGLKSFYESHKNRYTWKNRVDAIVISSTNEAMAKSAQKMLKQGKSIDDIKAKLNTGGKVNVMASSGVYEEGSDSFPKTAKRAAGVGEVVKEGEYFFATKINKVLPAGPKSLEEARGKVINDYQQYLESNWVADLKKEFTINLNRDVFENVKKQL